MSEDSSQEEKVQFFVIFTPLSEAQAPRASQELSTHGRTPRMRSGSWLPSGKRARAALDFEAADENTTVRARKQAPVEGR